MAWTQKLQEWVKEQARVAGFDLAGVSHVPEPDSADALEAERRFNEWVAAGHSGEMEWLKRSDGSGAMLRGELRRAIPWARSVVVCAVNYNAEAPKSVDASPANAGWIARYAWSGQRDSAKGADYHDVLLPQLKQVEVAIRDRFPGCETRSYVDTGPIVERGYAERAGVGWIGKNCCVINQQVGSWLLLGVVVTSIPLEASAWAIPASDRCGSCTRCIDACPTDALIEPRKMDASKCIAYLTIEKRGSIAEDLRPQMGRQVFGCDICQDVCPWNRTAPVSHTTTLPARGELVNPELAWLAAMDGPTFNRWFRGSPLERTSRKRVLRNVAIAMGNSGQAEFVPHLEEWAHGEDAVLAEAAQWALKQLGVEESLAAK